MVIAQFSTRFLKRAATAAGMRRKGGAFRRPIGRCNRCGVRFVATRPRADDTRVVLSAHQAACPGGDRRHEIAEPFAGLEPSRGNA